jgi:hypothetical protein
MNYSLILTIVLFSLCGQAQNYEDLIVRTKGDTIECDITLLNEKSVFFNYRPKRSEVNERLPLFDVLWLKLDGEVIQCRQNELQFFDPEKWIVIRQVDGNTREMNFNLAEKWAQVVYNKPEHIIKSDLETDVISIEGTHRKVGYMPLRANQFWMNYDYSFKIQVQEYGYKFEVMSLDPWEESTFDIRYWPLSAFKNADGKWLQGYDILYYSIENQVNDFEQSLYDYISNPPDKD